MLVIVLEQNFGPPTLPLANWINLRAARVHEPTFTILFAKIGVATGGGRAPFMAETSRKIRGVDRFGLREFFLTNFLACGHRSYSSKPYSGTLAAPRR